MSESIHPNIVLILADDMGYGDLSCLNPGSKIPTPHHDRIAGEGMTFTDAHSSSAVCTPSRYSILTGRYCWRSRLKRGVLWSYSPPLIEEDRPTLARQLQSAGYRTACVGKWHLGLGWGYPKDYMPHDRMVVDDPGIDFTRPLWSGPHTLGFEESFITASSLDIPPYFYMHNGRVIEEPTAMLGDSKRPAYWRGGRLSPGFRPETALLELTRRAEGFIDHHAGAGDDRPFFLYFPTTSPHTPHVPRQCFHGASEAGVYGDFVCEHDWSIGRVLAALDRNGLAEDTLVIVTSDNGSHAGPMNLDRRFGHHTNYHFRGQKTDIWDGGHRIPLLMRWPGKIAPGSNCETTVCLSDLFATLSAVTGQSIDPAASPDTTDLSPLLSGGSINRPPVVHHSAMGSFAIRTERWKLIAGPGSGGWTLPDQDVPPEAPRMQLYDMQADPQETENLIDRESAVAGELLETLTAIQGDTDVTPCDHGDLPEYRNR